MSQSSHEIRGGSQRNRRSSLSSQSDNDAYSEGQFSHHGALSEGISYQIPLAPDGAGRKNNSSRRSRRILRQRDSSLSSRGSSASRSPEPRPSSFSQKAVGSSTRQIALAQEPLSSSGGGKPRRRARRASLGAIPVEPVSNDKIRNMNYRVEANNALMNAGSNHSASSYSSNDESIAPKKPKRRIFGRRASMGDTPKEEPKKELEISYRVPSKKTHDDAIGGMTMNYRVKMPRRASMGDSPSTNEHEPMTQRQHTKAPRRGSLSDVPMTSSSNRAAPSRGILRMNSLSDATTDPSIDGFVHHRVHTKMPRRSSLSDAPPSNDGSLHSRPSLKMSRRSSLSDVATETPTNDGSLHLRSALKSSRRNSLNNVSTSDHSANDESLHLRSALKSSRRNSLNNVSTSDHSANDGSLHLRSALKSSRRNSLNNVSTSDHSANDGSLHLRSALKSSRRNSLNNVSTSDHSANDGSLHLRSALKSSRRNSLNNVTDPSTNDGSLHLRSALKSSRRSSLNNVSTSDHSANDGSLHLRSALKSSRRNSLTNVAEPANDGSLHLRSALKSSRRNSLNNVSVSEPSNDGSMHLRSALKSSRRSSLTNASEPSNDGSMHLRSALKTSRRSSLTNVTETPSTKVPVNFHSSINFNNSMNFNNSLNLDGSMNLNGSMSLRSAMKKTTRRNSLTMNASRRNSLSSAPKTTRRSSINGNPSRDTLTPLRSPATKSILRRGSIESTTSDGTGSRRPSFGDIGGASLGDGAIGLGDGAIGYSIPLKCSSERNERTTSRDISPKSRSERSMKKRTIRPMPQASNYYSDHSMPGSSIPSVPLDAFDSNSQTFNGYEDSKTSLQSGGRRRSSRTVYLSESDEGSEGYDSDEHSTTQRLDEMESSTRTGDSTMDDWSIDNLSADQYQSDLDAATTPFPSERSKRRGSSIKIPSASMDQHSNSTNQTGNRDDSEKLLCMEGNNWDDQSLPTFHDEDDLEEEYLHRGSRRRSWDGEWDADSSDDNTMGSIDQSVRSRVSFALPPMITRQSSENSFSIEDIADGNSAVLEPPPRTMTRQSSENSFSIEDFADMDDAPSSAPPSRMMRRQHSEESLSIDDFADEDIVPSGRSLPPRRMTKQSSELSITLFGNGGSIDGSESDSDSDGIIRDDELFHDAIMQEAFMGATDTDYTLSLSKTGDDLDFEESQKSIRFGRRNSDILSGGRGIDVSMRSQVSRAISTISEDSFEITSESLMNHSIDYGVYIGDDDSFYSSEDYSSSSEGSYDSDDEKAKEVRNGILWGIGGMGVGAIVGWIAKRFRNNDGETGVDLDDIDTLAKSCGQSVLDDSINFTGTDQLIGFLSMSGECGASGEIIATGIATGTSTAAPTTTAATTAATAAAVAAETTAQTTMAVTAASNLGGAAVTTTTAISNSAIAAGATAAAGGATTAAAGGTAATTAGVMTAVGLTGNGASAGAVVSSVTGAVAIAGSTYYTSGPMWENNPVAASAMNRIYPYFCPHLNPDNATGTFRLTIDVSGMKGQEEEWGWMPFSDGEGNNSTGGEILKELWEELFLSTYNNITNDGCNEMFERRVIDSMLKSSNHTGVGDGVEFLETEWEVTVECWETCPTEPIFGTEIERKLLPAMEQPVAEPETEPVTELDGEPVTELDGEPETIGNAAFEESKVLINMLDLQILLEQKVHECAEAEGWEKPETSQETVSIKEDKNKNKNKNKAVDTKSKTFLIREKEVEEEVEEEKKKNGKGGGRGGGKKKEDVAVESSITNMSNFTITSNSPYESRTKAPTLSPTVTKSPTDWPTESPTTAPSSPPSSSPTISPNSVQTNSPTDWPTESPTTAPSTSPTSPPTDSQSPSSSYFPSSMPTNSPTKSSIPSEDLHSSYYLSASPTTLPSKNPTYSPTIHPSETPSTSLSKGPSDIPTELPSSSPSYIPPLQV